MFLAPPDITLDVVETPVIVRPPLTVCKSEDALPNVQFPSTSSVPAISVLPEAPATLNL